jgi:hypothetical protein
LGQQGGGERGGSREERQAAVVGIERKMTTKIVVKAHDLNNSSKENE